MQEFKNKFGSPKNRSYIYKIEIKVMSKIEKSIVTPKWLKIKEMFEQGTNGSNKYDTNFEIGGELDELALELVDLLGEITQHQGFDCVVEGVKMDLWKERIWALIQNAGLLPEIAWRDELESESTSKDEWCEIEDEIDLEELAKQEYGF
jgi:hypothetical protein